MNNYAIYPSLMDEYHNMTKADDEVTFEARRRALIDKINREPQEPSEAKSRGTALNNVVDWLINQPSKQLPNNSVYSATLDGFTFGFAAGMVNAIVEVLMCTGEHITTQQYVSAPILCEHGRVRLYGFVDYIVGTTVIDLKTTKDYQPNKYRENWQHWVYTYCLLKNGLIADVDEFFYLIAELYATNGVISANLYKEANFPKQKDCVERITNFLDNELLPFIDDQRDLITNTKIFDN